MRFSLKDRRGNAMVEFALVAPLLILILLGIMVLGVVINSKIVVAGAAREAGRTWAIVQNDQQARDKAVAAMSGGGLKFSDDGAVLFNASRDVQFQRDGSYIRATVTYRQPTFAPLIGRLFGPDDEQGHVILVSQAVFRVER
ncbi:MAG TPA: TadE/TadG family type IV pilus assembly protein [Symbiobacteriaceae bacterium]